jgi:hypothetical protein
MFSTTIKLLTFVCWEQILYGKTRSLFESTEVDLYQARPTRNSKSYVSGRMAFEMTKSPDTRQRRDRKPELIVKIYELFMYGDMLHC